jgi:hypothetical protein
MRMFGRYLRQIFSTGWGTLFLIAGAISTCVTFVLIYKPGFALPYWVPGALSIAAWLVAPYRLYRHQQMQIEALTAGQQRQRRANLRVIEEQGSYYIRRSTPQGTTPKREMGMYLELSVSIENKGERSATITSYSLRIEGVGEFPDIRPSPQSWVWGLNAQHALNDKSMVSSYIEVPAERLASHQNIPFMLDAISPSDARQIRCELTVSDTEGNSASVWLNAIERG